MATSLSYFATPSTSSLSPPSTPPRRTQPLFHQPPNINKRSLASTPTNESQRPARRLFYSTSSSSFNDDYSSMTTASSGSGSINLLPAAPLFPPRTPARKSALKNLSLSPPSPMKRSPASRTLNAFTLNAFAEDEAADRLKLSGNGKGLASSNYFDYNSNRLSSEVTFSQDCTENVNSNDLGGELSSPELSESPCSSPSSGYSSEDEFGSRRMGLDSSSDEESTPTTTTFSSFTSSSPSAASIRRTMIRNHKSSIQRVSKGTLRSSFSSSSSIDSFSTTSSW